jgi:predicted ATPase with chaperone activity
MYSCLYGYYGDSQKAYAQLRCHRILELARTFSDLAPNEETQSHHLAEAMQYRPKIMMG